MIRITVVNRGPRHDATPFVPRFIDRLNQINPGAIQYRLVGNVLHCEVRNRGALSPFDQDMMRYIGRNQGGGVINPAGVLIDPPGGDHPISFRVTARTREFIDAYAFGTVDLADLLNCPEHSFQMNVLHILEERWQNPNYAVRRPDSSGIFRQGHREALASEATYLGRLLNEPTLRFEMEFDRAPTVFVCRFSANNGMQVEHVFTTHGTVSTSEIYVVHGGRRRTLQDHLAAPQA